MLSLSCNTQKQESGKNNDDMGNSELKLLVKIEVERDLSEVNLRNKYPKGNYFKDLYTLSCDYDSMLMSHQWKEVSHEWQWMLSSSGSIRYSYIWQFANNDTILVDESVFNHGKPTLNHTESLGICSFDKENELLYVEWIKNVSQFEQTLDHNFNKEMVLSVRYYHHGQGESDMWKEVLVLYEYKDANRNMSIAEILACNKVVYKIFIRC